MSRDPGHPIQPLIVDAEGVLRFKGNGIVRWLLTVSESHGAGLNEIAAATNAFSQEDRMQFAQLIGYSLCGYGELPYVTDEAYAAAEATRDDTEGGAQ